MLELTDLVVQRPDGHPVIGRADLSLAEGTINLLTGTNGIGTSTLCRTVTGRLERGWRVGGRVSWRNGPGGRRVSLLGLGAPELAGVIGCALDDCLDRALRARPAGGQTVRDLVLAQAAARVRRAAAHDAARQAIEALGLTDVATEPGWALSRSRRWALALAQAVAGRPALLVLDGVLGRLADDARQGLLQAAQQLAGQGSTVLWAEHSYEPVAEIADTVIELRPKRTPGALAQLSPADDWRPLGQPAPELMQLVKALGLDDALWRRPTRLNEMVRGSGRLTGTAGRDRARVHVETEPAHPPLEVPAGVLGVSARSTNGSADSGGAASATGAGQHPSGAGESTGGSETAGRDEGTAFVVDAGERLGVMCHDPDRARAVVSRLASALGAPPVGRAEALLSRETLDRVFASWDREYPAATPTLDVFAALLGPDVRLPRGTLRAEQLSAGQRMAARLAMLLGGSGPAVLTDPVTVFDPLMEERLATRLAADDCRARAVVIVGTSPELLIRRCDRIIEIDGDALVQDSGPLLAQRSPRCRTRLSRACAPLVVTNVAEAIALLDGVAR